MVKVINDPVHMTADEIRSQFDGYWVFLTNVEYLPGYAIKTAIPRVYSNEPHGGKNNEMFQKYHKISEYGSIIAVDYQHDELIDNLITALNGNGEVNE